MRLLLTAVHCAKSAVAANLERHLDLLAQGRVAGCDLVLLPEMSLTGYRADAALRLTDTYVSQLVEATAAGPALCFGLVEASQSGNAPYITQILAAEGRLAGLHRKAGLGEGENGPFRAGPPSNPVSVGGVVCSLAVCAEIGVEAPYQQESTLVLGPSAPGLYGARRNCDADWQRGFDWWRGSVLDDARRLLRPGRWLAVSTQAGATDDEDFPGWAALIGSGGQVIDELPDWREGTLVVEVPQPAASSLDWAS